MSLQDQIQPFMNERKALVQMQGTNLNNTLRKALQEELAPRIEKIKKVLDNYPERLYHGASGEASMIKFATAQELDQLVKYHCGARLTVHTEAYMFSSNEIVFIAFPVVLTENGLHVMDGAYASQKRSSQGLNIEKEALAVEARAVRRAFRKMGLRTEDKFRTSLSSQEIEELPVNAKSPVEVNNALPKKVAVKKAKTETVSSVVAEEVVHVPTSAPIQVNSNDMPERTIQAPMMYPDEMKRLLDEERKKRNLNWDKFIRNALGVNLKVLIREPNSRLLYTRLENIERQELYKYYILESGEL